MCANIPSLFASSGELISYPHVCKASALPPESSLEVKVDNVSELERLLERFEFSR